MFGAELGIGTIVIYVLDPDRGKRRRALLRDKCLKWEVGKVLALYGKSYVETEALDQRTVADELIKRAS